MMEKRLSSAVVVPTPKMAPKRLSSVGIPASVPAVTAETARRALPLAPVAVSVRRLLAVSLRSNPTLIARMPRTSRTLKIVATSTISARVGMLSCDSTASPAAVAARIVIRTPPEKREATAFKIVFAVPSLAQAREAAKANEGELYPGGKEWSFQGLRTCDGVDPEGNVFQLRELPADAGLGDVED